MLLHEGTGVGVQQVGIGEQGILVIVNQRGGGVEGEQVVHGRGHFKRAFIAMALHAFDPLGVGRTGTDHPVELFLQGADFRHVRLAVVTMVAGGLFAAQGFHGGQHAALELVVVVGVEQVVLAIVLVLQHRLHLAQPLGKLLAGRSAFVSATVGITPPVQVDLGQVLAALPQAPVNRALHARAIGTRFGAENAPAGLLGRGTFIQARLKQCLAFTAYFGGQRVHVVGFIQGGHRLHRRIEQADQVGKRIAEEPGYAQGHVHPRTVQ